MYIEATRCLSCGITLTSEEEEYGYCIPCLLQEEEEAEQQDEDHYWS